MEHLYAPWRSSYIHKKDNTGPCPFCITWAPEQDTDHFVIKRFESSAVFLNIFPYNAGHLLVVPFEHCAQLQDVPTQVRHELIDIATQATMILHKTFKNQGTNIGINSGGASAGGTVPEHLHIHVLPRFQGDTNFLATLAQTKAISFDLPQIYQQLHSAFSVIS